MVFWLTAFFLPIYPIVIVFALIGLLVDYWLDK